MRSRSAASDAASRSAAGRGGRERDWRRQLRERLRGPAELARFLGLPAPAGDAEAARAWPMAVTPYYASLIRRADARDPIFRLAAADAAERADDGLSPDPFAERRRMPVPGLVRRYRDRAALLVTHECAVRCRHCTRRNELAAGGAAAGRLPPAPDLPRAVAWLRRHPEVREVLVTGGDPLTLGDAALERVLRAVRSVPSVEIVRLGTRAPVVLPQRITPALCRMLRRFHPLWLNTHFNHPAELTAEAAAACARLADAGIPLGNQAVLLRGVNDRADVLEELFRGLLRMRVRPYYLLQCDPVRGAGRFRVPLARGLALIAGLRRNLSGLAVPQFVVDVPGGGGKVPLLPAAVGPRVRGGIRLRTPAGRLVTYPDAP